MLLRGGEELQHIAMLRQSNGGKCGGGIHVLLSRPGVLCFLVPHRVFENLLKLSSVV